MGAARADMLQERARATKMMLSFMAIKDTKTGGDSRRLSLLAARSYICDPQPICSSTIFNNCLALSTCNADTVVGRDSMLTLSLLTDLAPPTLFAPSLPVVGWYTYCRGNAGLIIFL